jgi:carbamoylphosphate synthase large subunit
MIIQLSLVSRTTSISNSFDLERHGVLEKHGVEMIGAKKEAIDKAEDRDLFQIIDYSCIEINE